MRRPVFPCSMPIIDHESWIINVRNSTYITRNICYTHVPLAAVKRTDQVVVLVKKFNLRGACLRIKANYVSRSKESD